MTQDFIQRKNDNQLLSADLKKKSKLLVSADFQKGKSKKKLAIFGNRKSTALSSALSSVGSTSSHNSHDSSEEEEQKTENL